MATPPPRAPPDLPKSAIEDMNQRMVSSTRAAARRPRARTLDEVGSLDNVPDGVASLMKNRERRRSRESIDSGYSSFKPMSVVDSSCPSSLKTKGAACFGTSARLYPATDVKESNGGAHSYSGTYSSFNAKGVASMGKAPRKLVTHQVAECAVGSYSGLYSSFKASSGVAVYRPSPKLSSGRPKSAAEGAWVTACRSAELNRRNPRPPTTSEAGISRECRSTSRSAPMMRRGGRPGAAAAGVHVSRAPTEASAMAEMLGEVAQLTHAQLVKLVKAKMIEGTPITSKDIAKAAGAADGLRESSSCESITSDFTSEPTSVDADDQVCACDTRPETLSKGRGRYGPL